MPQAALSDRECSGQAICPAPDCWLLARWACALCEAAAMTFGRLVEGLLSSAKRKPRNRAVRRNHWMSRGHSANDRHVSLAGRTAVPTRQTRDAELARSRCW